jgi:hypothetical protein
VRSDRRRTRSERDADYQRGVFINCPFDTAYQPLFDAIVFAVLVCGLVPRSALEIDDASQTRIDKIGTLIGDCRWGIHDISRVELNEHGLPRFNMPLELGLFLGAKRFGDSGQRGKTCLVLDSDPFRFQKFISDIAGQDITAHGGDTGRIITAIRNWLSGSLARGEPAIPGGADIAKRFGRFQADLPALCQGLRIEVHELTFTDKVRIVSKWLVDTEPKFAAAP